MLLSDTRASLRGAVATVLTVGVCACGGGGGGGGGPPANPNPVLGTTTFSTIENLVLNGTITATDPGGGAITFTQGSAPKSGTLSGFTSAGAFVYTPNPSFIGSDSFTVTATDAASHSTTGTVTVTVAADQAPVVNNTVARADTPTNVNVLAGAKSPTNESLTVTINPQIASFPPKPVTATVNSDQSVSISGLPPNFKGLTTFGYTVTDQSGMKTNGTAAIFVATDPFRAAFVADSGSPAPGSYEVYLTDFAASPVKESSATQGNLRLQGFAISDNGATIVYRTQDTTNAASTNLSLVQTATPGTPISITLPNGAVPVTDGAGKDQFVVSPDGKWIAVIAGQGGTSSLYVVQVAATPVVTQVVPMIASTPADYATQTTFTSNSSTIYFLATSVASGANKSLFVTDISTGTPSAPKLVSALSDPGSADEIYAYSVALNQSTIVEQANRAGRVGIFFIDPAHLTIENQINQAPATGYKVTTSTVGLAPGLGGSWSGTQVAYDVGDSSVADSVGGYVANVSTTPNPQLLAPFDQVLGFSPPVGSSTHPPVYLLYTDGAGLFDINTAGGSSGVQVGNGSQGWYDSTGNIVLLEQLAASGVTLSYNIRPFSRTVPILKGSSVYDVDVSGFAPVWGLGTGAILLGTPSSSGTAQAPVSLELVDASAPNDSLPLSSNSSPVHLTSYVSKVVGAH